LSKLLLASEAHHTHGKKNEVNASVNAINDKTTIQYRHVRARFENFQAFSKFERRFAKMVFTEE